MKKAKIVAISSVLALLLVACNSNDKPKDDGKNNGGFEYTEPDTKAPDVEDKTKLNFDLDGTVASVVEAAKQDDEKSIIALINAMDKNELYPNKIEGTISNEDNYDHDQNPATEHDDQNFKNTLTFEITRDNKEFKKDGTSTLKETTYKPAAIEASKTFTYSLARDDKQENIIEYYYEGTTKPAEPTRSIANNKANLKKEMKLIDLASYKKDILESIKKEKGSYVYWDEVNIGLNNIEGKEGNKNITIICKNNHEHQGIEYVNSESYVIEFAKEGWVTNLGYNKSNLAKFSATDVNTLESLTKNYTFSTVSIESEK